jgi:uncharacterized protein (TIGR03437 family)
MRLFSVAILLCHFAAAQFVQNAANPQIQGTIVPGSLINVSITPSNGQLPVLNPATVSLQIDTEQAQIVNLQGATVLALVPSDVPLGPGTVVLKVAPNVTAPVVVVKVVASDFGLFTNSSGIGQAIAQNITLGVVATNNLTHPGHPGDYVTLYGTGLGSAQVQVAVLLGGHSAPVSFAGHSPALPGVDQINFQVPNDIAIPNGCFVAVQVIVNGVESNIGSVSKAVGPGACSPPIDLTEVQMAQLDAGQNLPFVSFSIDGFAAEQSASTGFLRNESFGVEAIITNEASLATISPPLVADDVFYGCAASSGGTVGAILVGSGGVDLGPKLTLTGPGTTGYILTSPGQSFYSLGLPTGPPVTSPDQLPPPYFVPGVWQIAGAGSQPNPYFQSQYPTLPFQAQITIPPVIQLAKLC